MPYGQKIVLCFTCGKQYTAGDCITHECPACERRRERGESAPKPITDTDRLDWLIGAIKWTTAQDGSRVYTFTTPPTTPSFDVRKAIDTAISEQGKEAG